MTKHLDLESQLSGDGIVVAPGIFDAMGAVLVEQAGFHSAYLSGASIAYTRFGQPDIGLVSMSEVADALSAITERSSLRIIVDADTGFGNALNVMRTVRLFENIGAAAIQLEDQTLPKRCGHLAGKTLVPTGEMVGKIKAALDARSDPDFVVIARCDAYAVTGWDDTIKRSHAYIDAGADLVFVDGIKSREDIENYARDMGSLPRMYNGDLANTKEMDALGYKVMICGSTIWLIYKQLKDSFTELMEEGAVNPDRYGTRWDVAGLLGLDDVYELEQKYGVTEAPVA